MSRPITPRVQQSIYENVVARGYSPQALGLTDEQFACRNIIKSVEEINEVLRHIVVKNKKGMRIHLNMTEGLEQQYRQDFDDVDLWKTASIEDMSDFLEELADVFVPLFCTAEALSVSAVSLAKHKSKKDISRGVRG